jgi:hypothetical protein
MLFELQQLYTVEWYEEIIMNGENLEGGDSGLIQVAITVCLERLREPWETSFRVAGDLVKIQTTYPTKYKSKSVACSIAPTYSVFDVDAS